VCFCIGIYLPSKSFAYQGNQKVITLARVLQQHTDIATTHCISLRRSVRGDPARKPPSKKFRQIGTRLCGFRGFPNGSLGRGGVGSSSVSRSRGDWRRGFSVSDCRNPLQNKSVKSAHVKRGQSRFSSHRRRCCHARVKGLYLGSHRSLIWSGGCGV